MNCIIVEDEPLARKGLQMLAKKNSKLNLMASLTNSDAAADFLQAQQVDLVFLDIQMPGRNGIAFAQEIADTALIIFTTAFSQFAIDSYEVHAVDYLLKPIRPERFAKAVEKANTYKNLLQAHTSRSSIESVEADYFFVKADRKIFKVDFNEILFIEGLKDYVIIHTKEQKLVTAMNIKTVYSQLPESVFARVSKSYIINLQYISCFDNNIIFIQQQEIPIGEAYRNNFFEKYVSKKLFTRQVM